MKKKVNFCELDAENKDTACSQMFYIMQKYNYPFAFILWTNEDDLKEDLKQDYKPDEHFTFYVDEFGEVETKIG